MTKSSLPHFLKAALVGNPNCGKTTLFNRLTGARQRVGNWPGVTVERKSGVLAQASQTLELIDLPGVYALHQAGEGSIDERIALEFILKENIDVIVNIVDASNLERHLYLTLQLLALNIPVILVLNMVDVAKKRGIQIDFSRLQQTLNIPIIQVNAAKGHGLQALKKAMLKPCLKTSRLPMTFPKVVESAIHELSKGLESKNHMSTVWMAEQLLENDHFVRALVPKEALEKANAWKARIQKECHEDADILIAEARYNLIGTIKQECLQEQQTKHRGWSKTLDNIVLNRVLGIPIFLAMMYCLFLFSINIGGAFQDFFDMSSEALFVDGGRYLLSQWGAPTWVIAIAANGIGKGINTTITFIPVIFAMFLFLAFLEDSGYMARAAFIIDRLMRALGLPGKAFVPMIVGFGCNVPSVMAARTLENKRDRILTVMMSPFMSCGARLAIFAIFTTAFFKGNGQNIIFALYLIGILMAVLTGFILRKTMLRGEPAPLMMELPSYHLPHFKTVLLHTWHRLKSFIFRAGKLIVPICVVIGVLNTINIDGSLNDLDGGTNSLLSTVGQWLTPIFAPMGLQNSNWPATVGLVTGVLAKEVVVGTLNTLYTQMGHLAVSTDVASFHLWSALMDAVKTIPENFMALKDALVNPVLAKAPIDPVEQGVYGLMSQQFDGKIGAFAYLLFVLLYFPCISTTAVVLRELHRGWAIFSGLWMTGVAYGVAVMFYQAATFTRHPLSSALWLFGLASLFIMTIAMIHAYAGREERQKENTYELA